jgi:Transposase IS66 family
VRVSKREPGRGNPLGMSEAWSSNPAAEAGLIRGHCLAPGRRKFTELAADCPAESAGGVDALKLGSAQEAEAREKPLRAEERLVYPPTYRAPGLTTRKTGLEQQTEARWGDPHSRLGQASAYLLDQGDPLTRVVKVPGAPRDNKGAERARKVCIRPRQNALFSATAPRGDLARVRTSVMATWGPAGVTAREYRVAVQEPRPEGFAPPAAWLPWPYPAALVPPEATWRHSGAIGARAGKPFHRSPVTSRADPRTLGVVAVGPQ